MVVALIALFSSLTGVAAGVSFAKAVPLAKKALIANNAKKLQGKTKAQIIASAKTKSVAGFVTIKSASWSLASGVANDFVVTCDPGQKAIGGGAEQATPASGGVWYLDSRPSSDGASWKLFFGNISGAAKTGTVYAVCLG
jgi:uncharacterized protein YfiM (DUF2279 family)